MESVEKPGIFFLWKSRFMFADLLDSLDVGALLLVPVGAAHQRLPAGHAVVVVELLRMRKEEIYFFEKSFAHGIIGKYFIPICVRWRRRGWPGLGDVCSGIYRGEIKLREIIFNVRDIPCMS